MTMITLHPSDCLIVIGIVAAILVSPWFLLPAMALCVYQAYELGRA